MLSQLIRLEEASGGWLLQTPLLMARLYKRLSLEEWQNVLTFVAFFLTFGAFIYFTIRALRMKKDKRDHMANLPLEEEGEASPRAD